MLFKVNISLIFLVLGTYASNSSLNDSIRGLDNAEKNGRVVTWSMVTKEFKRLVNSFLSEDLSTVYDMFEKINISSRCHGSLIETAYAFQNMTGWALRMVDASGKLPGGILEGTMMDFGSYSECLKITVKDSDEDKESFRGRYCMVGYTSPLLSQKTPSGKQYIDVYGVPPSWASAFMDKAGPFISQSGFWFGTCVPSSCSEENVKEIFTSVTKSLGMSVNVDGCQVADEPTVWSVSTIIAMVILGFLLCMCLLGTTLDVILRRQVEKSQHFETDYLLFRLLLAFSVYSNTENLFAAVTRSNNNLSCFNGIRFFSALWVILSHTYCYHVPWNNEQYRDESLISDLYDSLLSSVLDKTSISVETFFFISGFLLVHVTWKKLKKCNGKLNPLMFFFRKYCRMTPSLGLIILLFLVLPVIGSGPLWKSTLDDLVGDCKDSWWSNFLYINNFWSIQKQCLPHTWYLAALMQLSVIGIVILLLAFRSPRLGIFLGIFTAVASCAAIAVIVILYDFQLPTAANRKYNVSNNYNEKIYLLFYDHAPTYLVGMALGFLFTKYKDKQIGKGYQVLGWLLAVLCALSSEYGIRAPLDNVVVRAFYTSCHSIGWSLSVGWLTFACITGRGGIVNRLLSWNAFTPLGQLCFLVYLFHPLIIYYRMATISERMTYGHIDLVFEFLAFTVIAFFLAYIGHVTVERPFQILERMLFQNQSDNLKKTANDEEHELKCQNKILPA